MFDTKKLETVQISKFAKKLNEDKKSNEMSSASTAHESAKSKRESSGDRDEEMDDLSQPEPINEFNDPAAGGFINDPASGGFIDDPAAGGFIDDPASGGQSPMKVRQIQSDLVEKPVKFKFGDKFTKKPLHVGKHLILLGRIHIQVFDLETFQTKIVLSGGEDQAEKLG